MSTDTKGELHSVPWGIPIFDTVSNGLPRNDISVIQTPDYYTGQIILGHFIYHGLKNGEKCVFITFDSAISFLQNFINWNLNFEKYLESGQLVLLNYKANISNEIGLTHNYDAVFDEILRLGGEGKNPSRIAIQQLDTLVNLNNIILMNQSAQKLTNASAHHKSVTVLGQFVQYGDETHRNLSIALQKTVKGFFTLEQPTHNNPYQFLLTVKKLPWFKYIHYPVEMDLIEGEGFGGAEVKLDGRAS